MYWRSTVISRYARDLTMIPPGKDALPRLERSIEHEIDEQFPFFCFDGPITLEQFITHIIFFLYKEYYKEHAIRRSYGEHYQIQENADNPERRSLNRSMQSMYERKVKDEARLRNYNPIYRDKVMTKENSKSPRGTYLLNNTDFMAIENYSPSLGHLSILPMLEDGRMVVSKKASGKNISAAYKEYMEYIQSGADESDPEKWIERLIDLSDLESQCAPSFLYAVSIQLVRTGKDKIPKELALLCGHNDGIESRFLYDRIRCIDFFFSDSQHGMQDLCEYFMNLLEIQRFLLRETGDIWDHLLQAISVEDAKRYFEKRYDLFDALIFPALRKETTWPPNHVKLYRKVVAYFTHDGAEQATKVNKPEQ